MRFELLGPLRVLDGPSALAVPPGRQRILLVQLLLRANGTVGWEELADGVWQGAPPASARSVLPTHVLRLRRSLGPTGGSRVVTGRSGYSIEVRPGELDVDEFHALLAEAETGAEERNWAECRVKAAAARALWRGSCCEGVPLPAAEADVARTLAEARLNAAELQFQAELELGRHRQVVAELVTLAEQHPRRERLVGQAVTGLYRCARQAEALDVYQRTRRILVADFGVDPGPALQSLHRRVLRRDPGLDGPPEPVRPAAPPERGGSGSVAPKQLPAAVQDFTGREQESDRLAAHLAVSAEGVIRPRSAALVGAGGIGKSALALHVAHRLADDFPEGQLFASIGGSGPDPVAAHEVQARFLRALGTPAGEIPVDRAERTGLYRSVLASRRVLIVLDDARDGTHVAELLPGSGASAVLLTTRDQLSGWTGGRVFTLDLLAAGDARNLFERVVSSDRTATEPDAVDEVLAICAGLPLAIRIAGARLACRPQWSVRVLAARLADSSRTLRELTVGDLSVQACLALGYAGLLADLGDDAASPARCLRLLGVAGLVSFEPAAVAALLGASEEQAEGALESLVDRRLLENPYPGEYRLHDLTRLYAGQVARSDESPESRGAAARRLRGRYLASAEAAAALLRPASADEIFAADADADRVVGQQFTDRDQALAWFEAQRANLVALCGAEVHRGAGAFHWRLAEAMRPYFILSRHWSDWLAVFESGLAAATDADEPLAAARMRDGLGMAYIDLRRLDLAASMTSEAIEAYRRLDREDLEALALSNLTGVLARQGRPEDGMAAAQRALRIQKSRRDWGAAAVTLSNFGMLQVATGSVRKAVASYLQALEFGRTAGHRYAEAAILSNLGEAYIALGAHAVAAGSLREALALCDDLGTAHGRAMTLAVLGDALEGMDRRSEAREALAEAAQIFTELGAPEAQAVRARLAEPAPERAAPAGGGAGAQRAEASR